MKPPEAKPLTNPTPQEARQQRRAQALRDNLRRRKIVKNPTPPSENDG
jgi:hypothetical protein